MYRKNLFSNPYFSIYLLQIWRISDQKASAYNTPIIPQFAGVVKELKKCFSKAEHKLHAIEQWSQSTNLFFNSKKTKSMFFSTINLLQYYQLYDDTVLTHFFFYAPFLYPLKTSKNLRIFWFFQRVGKRCIGNKWVNDKL